MNTDTPRTNEALAAILERDGNLSEENAPSVLVKLCRTMERERDEARKAAEHYRNLYYLPKDGLSAAKNHPFSWENQTKP